MIPDSSEIAIENAEIISEASKRRSATWDIGNAPRNYLSLVLSQAGSVFFAFASVWLITKVLGAEGYGGVFAIIAASQVAQVLINWTAISVVRFGTEEFVETEKIARAFWLRFFIFVPNVLIVLLAAKFWFPPLADWLKLSAETFWLVILHFSATALWVHVQMGFQAAKLPRMQGILLMFERLLIFAGILLLIFYGKLTPFSALICYAVAPFLMITVGIFFLRRFIFARFSIDLQFVKKIATYSLPLIPFAFIGYFSTGYVDAIFISKYLSTRDLGIYSVAVQISGIALQLPTLANSLLIPFFVTVLKENSTTKLNSYFKTVLPSLTLVWGILCTLMAFAGAFLIPLIFGSKFAESVTPFWILMTASIFAVPVACGYSALVHARSVTYIAAITALLSAVVNISLNFLLIPQFGMEGCAWATFITYFISVLAFVILLNRKTQMSVSWIFIAFMPTFIGTLVYSYTENVWLGLAFSSMLAIFAVLLKQSSLRESFGIMMRIIKK